MTPLAALVSTVALLGGGIHAVVTPAVATRDGQVRVAITGAPALSAQVRVVGGLASGGKWFNWVALRSNGAGSWWTILRAPGYYGVYPLELRTPGRRAVELDSVVEILPKGFFARLAFREPRQVAQWWTRAAPAGAVLGSVSTWGSGFYTHRDLRFNRLLAVRFRLLGDWPRMHLHTGAGRIFLSIARVRSDGAWRLLETVTTP